MTAIGAICSIPKHRVGLSLQDICRCAHLASNLEGNEDVRKVFVWWCAHLMHKHSNDREVIDAIRQGSSPKAWNWFIQHFGGNGKSNKVPWNRMMEYLQKCECSLAEFFLRYLKTITSEEAVRRQQANVKPRAQTLTGFTAFARNPTSTGNVQFVRMPTSTGFVPFVRAKTSTGNTQFVRMPTSTGFVYVPRVSTSTGVQNLNEGLGRITFGHSNAEKHIAFRSKPVLHIPDVAVRSAIEPVSQVSDVAIQKEKQEQRVQGNSDTESDDEEVSTTLGKRMREDKSWKEMSRPEKAKKLLETLVSNGKVQCTDEGYSHYRMVVRGGRNGTRLLTEDEEMLMNVDGLRKDERNALKALVSF